MKPETRSFYEQSMARAVERVIADLDGALDLRALARGAALSPFHFHRVFRGLLGETPLELHRRLRMERAAFSLLHEDTPITNIAFMAGYETHESFTRAFRAHYDCSPSEVRQRRRTGDLPCARPFSIELAARSGIHFRPHRSEAPVIHFIRGDEHMDVDIKERPELRVATTTHIGPYHRISEAFARLGQTPGIHALFAQEPTMLAIYYDDPESTPASELRSEAAVAIAADAKVPETLSERRIPAGRYACTTHVGPYDQLGDVWARFIGEWLPQSGYRMRDEVSFEIYRNTPGEVPNEQLRTELYIPLQ
ncbi:Transcriptional regulator, AraC family protein [Minicystis rosea]|nr:Transcriptional regulator, AraC family protein [Minicystis rosea]